MKERVYTDKFHLILGGAFFLLLAALLFLYPGDSAKHLIFGGVLALGTGVLICLRPLPGKVSAVLLVLYLLYVPGKLFTRMELPVYDMSLLTSQAKTVSLLLIIALYLLMFVICRRVGIALAVSNVLLLVIAITEFYVNSFRGSVLGPNDLLAANTAISVMGHYDYTPSHELVYSALWFLFFTVLATRIRLPFETKCEDPAKKKRRFLIRGAVDIVIAVSVICFIRTLLYTPFLNEHGINSDLWRYYKTNEVTGNLLYPMVEYRNTIMDRPADFTEDKLKGIGEKAAEAYVPRTLNTGVERPNIILIMNEAFSDLSVMGNLETTEPYMPFWDSLKDCENCVGGNLYMSILGGLTVNSEFEVLTGNSLYFLSANAIPYETMISPGTISLAKELKAVGYDTMAMHPNASHAYHRESVYRNMEFDDFIYADRFEVPLTYRGSLIDDASNYREIINRYEKRESDAPWFLFDVTIQNHSDYEDAGYRDIGITKVGVHDEMDTSGLFREQIYINLIKQSDDAFRELIEYFENVEEPTIICMFGDHQPLLSEWFYQLIFDASGLTEAEQEQKKYIVPYVIWANYDANLEDLGDMSANYLGEALMYELGLPMSEYRQFQDVIRRQIPILSARQTTTADGIEIDPSQEAEYPLIGEYRWLQYDRQFNPDRVEAVHLP